MTDRASKDAWIRQVLGIVIDADDDLEEEEVAPDEALRRAVQGLSDGYDLVNAQIASLQATLRNAEDPDMRRIAEYGLNALTGGLRVKLQAAVMPLLAGGSGNRQNRRRVHEIADGKRQGARLRPQSVRRRCGHCRDAQAATAGAGPSRVPSLTTNPERDHVRLKIRRIQETIQLR